ncbi:MAG: hypothetical protein V7K48_15965 [Nostoc sp.]
MKHNAKAGLTVKQEFIDPTYPYHYFLVLEKIQQYLDSSLN